MRDLIAAASAWLILLPPATAGLAPMTSVAVQSAEPLVGGTSAFWCIAAGVATGAALLSGQWWAAAGFIMGAGMYGCL
jgi:hypothetical protein